ncbi:MAG: dienelactone hydrolase family protein [Natronospirillum sp.]
MSSTPPVTPLLPCVEVEPKQPATHTVIWLHGLGADGHDFVPIVPELHLPSALAVRFVFPHAPHLAVTINGGVSMPAWYDILELQIERRVDDQQLRASAQAVHALIAREEARGIPSQNIVVAGFSQGGAVAYEAALTYPTRLGGLMALSTYFATRQSVQCRDANQLLPILIHHGTQDPIVPEALGRTAQAELVQRGYTAVYQTFPMAHGVCPEQISVLGHWLTTLFTES